LVFLIVIYSYVEICHCFAVVIHLDRWPTQV